MPPVRVPVEVLSIAPAALSRVVSGASIAGEATMPFYPVQL
jgi:hypothetical protein